MPIAVLPSDVASKIAAGEVVERPASVVKELVENAIDALATAVTVEIGLGGLRLLRVADNGAGIPAAEASLALQRHATSKITTVEDLDGVTTLGFRGEALASIAAVADLTLVTRVPTAEAAIQLRVENGEIVEQGPRAAPVGTTITVRNLFARVPARLKFVRSTAAETAAAQRTIADLSLFYPHVQFCLVVDGRTTFQTTGSGKLEDAAARVFGAQVARDLLPLGRNGGLVSGLVCRPAHGRTGRHQLVFAVNNRLIQSRMLVHAVEDAYRGFMMVDRRPLGVVLLSLPPGDVDVNVHPTKAEVRFRNDREIYGEVQRAIREALAASPVGYAPDEEARPAATDPTGQVIRNGWGPSGGWPVQPARDTVSLQTALFGEVNAAPAVDGEERLPVLRVVGQVGLTYIITEGPDGLYLLDQHAAHERIQYDRFRKQFAARSVEVQGLLDPLAVELTPIEQAATIAGQESLQSMGFGLEPFGESTLLVRAIPSILREGRIDQAVREVIGALVEQRSGDDWRDRAAAQVACHGSVRAGQALTTDEMRALVRQLETTDSPQTCPHGRPTLVRFSAIDLERHFGRR